MSPISAAATKPTISQEEALLATAEADWQRPAFHFHPPAFWLNDPNGTITLDGWHHVFYQYCPGREDQGPKHWGHARSRDLIDWEHLGVALAPDASIGEEGVWSGAAALAEDGTPVLVYTSYPLARDGRFRQVAVVCDRGLTRFARVPGPLLATDDDTSIRRDARDPFLFRANGKTWMVHGCVRGDHSVILLHEAVSGDLRSWRFHSEMLRWPTSLVPFPECPNMVPLGGDRWVLLLSPYGPVEGYVGMFRDGVFTVEREVRCDHHDSFYATNVLEAANGAPVLITWVRGWPSGRGWDGCLAAPRLVHADARAGIRQEILPTWIAGLAEGAAQAWQGELRDATRILDAHAGDQVVVDLTLTRAAGGSLACDIGCAEDGSTLRVAWRGDRLVVAGQATVLSASADSLDLRILVDRSLIEVFANGGRTVVTRIQQRKTRGAQLRLATAGSVHIEARWQRLRAATYCGTV